MPLSQSLSFVKGRWILALSESNIQLLDSVHKVIEALAENDIVLTDVGALFSPSYTVTADSTALITVEANAIRVRFFTLSASSETIPVTDLSSVVKVLTKPVETDLTGITQTANRTLLMTARSASNANALQDTSSYLKVSSTFTAGQLVFVTNTQDQIETISTTGTGHTILLGSGPGGNANYDAPRSIRTYSAGSPHRYFYVKSDNEIRSVRANGSNNVSLKVNAPGISALTLDPVGGVIYYNANNAIRKMNLDGSGDVQILATGTLNLSMGLVYASSLLYICDRLNSRIYRIATDGTGGTALITGRTGHPFYITQGLEASVGDSLYWSEIDGGSVVGATRTGATIYHTITGFTQPLGVVLDGPNRRLYVCESVGANKGIWRIPTGNFGTQALLTVGTKIHTHVPAGTDPWDITLT